MENGGTLTVGWVAILGLASTMLAFVLGFCARARIYERQIDELVVVVKRPSTFPLPQPGYTAI